MHTPVVVALVAGLLGLGAGVVLRARLAAGHHRYPDDPPAHRHAWVVPGTGIACSAVAYGLADWAWPVLVTAAVAAAIGVLLAAIDLEVHRLPRVITWPCYPVLAVLLTICSWAARDWPALGRAALGGLAAWAVYYLLHRLAGRRSLGRGDVTLAGLIGMLLGWFGWTPLGLASYLAFLLAGVVAGALLLLRRVGRKDRIAFGPAMIAAALIVLALQ
ncbi:MAG: A24 family peptidase [Dermatophilaceae bacterium]